MTFTKNVHKHTNRSSYSNNSDLKAQTAEILNQTQNVTTADIAFFKVWQKTTRNLRYAQRICKIIEACLLAFTLSNRITDSRCFGEKLRINNPAIQCKNQKS